MRLAALLAAAAALLALVAAGAALLTAALLAALTALLTLAFAHLDDLLGFRGKERFSLQTGCHTYRVSV
jgi:hypothetical protein